MNNRTTRATTALLQRRARALKRHLPLAVAGDHHGVHQARVATRRLREAVPVLSTGLKDSKAAKAGRKIRRLTRALGTVRELDVTIQILDELARAEHLPRLAVEAVRGHVIAERDARREVMLKRLGKVDAQKLGRRLASVADALDAAENEAWRDVLAARLTRRALRLGEAIEAAGQMYLPERLHRVRIAAKKLRYALELAADSGTARAADHLRMLKRTQDVLGRLHDLQILHSHVAAVQAQPDGSGGGAPAAFDALAQHIEGECRHLHARYLVSSADLLETCRTVGDTIAPALGGVPKRRRPLKMGLARKSSVAQGGR